MKLARGPREPMLPAAARALAIDTRAQVALLVEGWSDQAAVETLARMRGLDLRAGGIVAIPIGGITNLRAFVLELGPAGLGLALVGLCDAAEEAYTRRTLERAGLGAAPDREALEALGFFVCEADLEDELIRALGPHAVEAVLREQGELESFRRFQNQPAQRGRELKLQLRRFMGTRATRKIRYGTLLVEALGARDVPRPLSLVIERAGAAHRRR